MAGVRLPRLVGESTQQHVSKLDCRVQAGAGEASSLQESTYVSTALVRKYFSKHSTSVSKVLRYVLELAYFISSLYALFTFDPSLHTRCRSLCSLSYLRSPHANNNSLI